MILLAVMTGVAGFLGTKLPQGFIPQEDLGYLYLSVQLPAAASLQRTAAVCDQIDAILKTTPGVQYYTGVAGFSLLSTVFTTYNAFYFITLEPWDERTPKGLNARVILTGHPRADGGHSRGRGLPVPAAGHSRRRDGGRRHLRARGPGRQGRRVPGRADARPSWRRPASGRSSPGSTTTLLPSVPQYFADVDRDKVLRQDVDLQRGVPDAAGLHGRLVRELLQPLRPGVAGLRAGGGRLPRAGRRTWGSFYVRNQAGTPVPLSSLVTMRPSYGPEFTLRYNEYRSAQINGILRPGVSTSQGMKALEEVFAQTMPREMGFDYMGMSFQEQVAAKGVPASVVFGCLAARGLSHPGRPVRELVAARSPCCSAPPSPCSAPSWSWPSAATRSTSSPRSAWSCSSGWPPRTPSSSSSSRRPSTSGAQPLVDAALAGARLRLRPILMTALAFILGVLPLYVATGAGAASRRVLGTTVFGGMLAASFIAIFIIPDDVLREPALSRSASRPDGPAPRRSNRRRAERKLITVSRARRPPPTS